MRGVVLLALLLSGCATTIENGNFKLKTYANASRLVVTGPGVSLEAVGLNHSIPTGTALRSAGQLIGTAATAALPFTGATPAVQAAPIVSAIAPLFRY